MPRVSFHTLGCKLNYADTGQIARQFRSRDYEIVPFGEPADVTVINTCTVTEQAEQKCRNVVRRAVKTGEHPFVIVTGCYAQLRPAEIAAIEGVDAVVGTQEKFHLFDLIRDFSRNTGTEMHVSCIDEVEEFGPSYAAGGRTRAFLKIQDGCDYSCSFCTIPQARGKSRSHGLPETLDQVNEIVSKGFSEIVLSGVNLGLYGQAQHTSLLELIKRLGDVNGLKRVRISSIEPNLLTDAIIDAIGASSVVCPHLHVPLQSGDDTVLGSMRRRYRSEFYRERLERAVATIPDVAIGADVIVGFPGETEETFQNTFRFVEALPVAYLHVFTYSERPGTAAHGWIKDGSLDAVAAQERSKRSKRMRGLSFRKRTLFNRAQVGSIRPVLWEEAKPGDASFGYSDNYIRVRRAFDPAIAGSIESVRLSRDVGDGTMVIE